MSRRSGGNTSFLLLVAAIAAAPVIFRFVDKNLTAIIVVAAVIAVPVGAGLIFTLYWNDRTVRIARERIDQIAREHARALAIRRTQLLTQDHYGTILTQPWANELEYFYASVVERQLRQVAGPEKLSSMKKELIRRIDQIASDEVANLPAASFDLSMTGTAYEEFCADLLRQAGWHARVTKASGDQGTDVLAEKDGMSVAIQCKRYSGQVGNAAVQEAHAGKAFYRTSHAAVVASETFTNAARQLAQSTGVLLLHHNDLATLEHRLKRT